jgi:hypothetical protein
MNGGAAISNDDEYGDASFPENFDLDAAIHESLGETADYSANK